MPTNHAPSMAHSQPLGSVVVPAHNEARVIGRCLGALLAGSEPGELEIVVVCNGCHDDTAALARSVSPALRVIELAVASKPAALRAGDDAAIAFPRLYLDADVLLGAASARRVLQRLKAGALAARPPLRYDSSHSSTAVRSYYRARSRVPAVLGSLWGAGVYGLSRAGRDRFDAFPDVVADDLWLDRQFDRSEVEIVDCEPVVVAVPRTTRDLLRILRRAYRGRAETHAVADADAGAGAGETTTATVLDLSRLLAAGPGAALDATTYAMFATVARIMLALGPGPAFALGSWERDESSRRG